MFICPRISSAAIIVSTLLMFLEYGMRSRISSSWLLLQAKATSLSPNLSISPYLENPAAIIRSLMEGFLASPHTEMEYTLAPSLLEGVTCIFKSDLVSLIDISAVSGA